MVQQVRDDPSLCFLERCGPSPESLMASQTPAEGEEGALDKEEDADKKVCTENIVIYKCKKIH